MTNAMNVYMSCIILFLKIISELSCDMLDASVLLPFIIFIGFCFIQEAGHYPSQATAPTDEGSSVREELPFPQRSGWISRWMDKETSRILGPPYSSLFCASWQAYVLHGSQKRHAVVHVVDPASTSRCFLGNNALLPLQLSSTGASQWKEVPGSFAGEICGWCPKFLWAFSH